MLARVVLEQLGTPFTLMFLPAVDAELWTRALGAHELRGFVMASGAYVLPEFPPRFIEGIGVH